jgi:hypothetical protein
MPTLAEVTPAMYDAAAEEAAAAAAHDAETQAAAAHAAANESFEFHEAAPQDTEPDFLSTLGLDAYRHQVVSRPGSEGTQGTLQEAVAQCPAFATLLSSLHRTAGANAVTAIVQKNIERTAAQPKPKAEPAQKAEIKAPEKPPKPAKADQKIELPVVTPELAITTPVVSRPETTANQPTVIAAAKIESVPLPEPKPTVAVIADAHIEHAFFAETGDPQAQDEPSHPSVEPAVRHETAPKPEDHTPDLRVAAEPQLTKAEDIPPAITAFESLAEKVFSEPTVVETPTELDELEPEPLAIVDREESVDLSHEVDLLLAELGLPANTVAEPPHAENPIAAEEVPAEALTLPAIESTTDETPDAQDDAFAPPLSPYETAAHTTESLTEADLPPVLQLELVEKIEQLAPEAIPAVQAAAETVLQAAVRVTELATLPETTPTEQIAAIEQLEAVCTDLLQILGLPADTENAKQFSRYILRVEQFTHILRMENIPFDIGTHERKRGDLGWLHQLVQFITDQLAERQHILGWSALKLTAPLPATA